MFMSTYFLEPLKLNVTRTHYFVSRSPLLHASALRVVLCHHFFFVLFPRESVASCSRSVWGCLPQPTQCFDYRFVLRASGTHRFVGRCCVILNVLNVCSKRTVVFSLSTLTRAKQKNTSRSDPAVFSAYTDLRQGHAGSQLGSL